MLKKEARALLAAQRKIYKALEVLEQNLSMAELQYAEGYYLTSTRNIWSGSAFGGPPIARAEEILDV